jgi:hypothetical protein
VREVVTVHYRDAAGIWQTRLAQGADSILIGYQLSLDAVYQDVPST